MYLGSKVKLLFNLSTDLLLRSHEAKVLLCNHVVTVGCFFFSLLSLLHRTGESQYCAFLLLKALQTVVRTYEVKRGLRAIRAGSSNPVRGNQCGLRSLTVSLERHVIGPNTANINNCHGSCAFPLVNPSNHAVLLNSHIEKERAVGGSMDERAPCCVPVAYEDMDLVLLDAQGTGTELRPLKYMVAKECGCR